MRWAPQLPVTIINLINFFSDDGNPLALEYRVNKLVMLELTEAFYKFTTFSNFLQCPDQFFITRFFDHTVVTINMQLLIIVIFRKDVPNAGSTIKSKISIINS